MFGVNALNCVSEAAHRKFTDPQCADLFYYLVSRSFRINAASMVRLLYDDLCSKVIHDYKY